MIQFCYLFILFLSVISVILSFNVDIKSRIVIEDPSISKGKGSYFGYALSLLQDHTNKTWLYVGAPKANSSLYQYNDVNEPGVLFRCLLNQDTQCEHVILDTTGNMDEISCGRNPICDKKDGAWIGGTVAVSKPSNEGVRVATCGWRWTNQRYSKTFYLTNGVCYWMEHNISLPRTSNKLTPLSSKHNQGLNLEFEKQAFYYAYGQAGVSATFAKNGEELLIGAPGVLDWTGTVIKYSDKANSGELINTALRNVIIPNPIYTPQLESYDYAGYTVSSGHFLPDTHDVMYVLGSPRGADLRGKILIFKFPAQVKNQKLHILAEKHGVKMGEYFGSSLIVCDVTNDGLDDILVGAPLYSLPSSEGDQGRVDVFINQGQLQFLKKFPLSGRNSAGARFGSSLVCLGDINHDGYIDVAVGAPYELIPNTEATGAVYIYHGRSDSVLRTYVQRITAEIHNGIPIRGFGISLSSDFDADRNAYPDLAVGAYESGHVTVYFSRPIVNLKATLTPGVERLHIDAEIIYFQMCLTFIGYGAPDFMDVEIILRMDTLEVQPRIFINTTEGNVSTFNLVQKLSRKEPMCWNFTAFVKTQITTFSNPIRIQSSFKPSEEENCTFDTITSDGTSFVPLCPVVDPSHRDNTYFDISFATGCEGDGNEVCHANLKVIGTFIGFNNETHLVIGQHRVVTLEVTVINNGENAFQPYLYVVIPFPATVSKLPKECQNVMPQSVLDNNHYLQCDLVSPLGQGKQVPITVDIDISRIRSGTPQLDVDLTTGSASQEYDTSDNNKKITLFFQTRIDVAMHGIPGRDFALALSDDPNSQQQRIFLDQKFQARNYEDSPTNLIELIFKIPVGLHFGSYLPIVESVKQKDSFVGQDMLICKNDITFSNDYGVMSVNIEDKIESKVRRRKRQDYQVNNPSVDLLSPGLASNNTFYFNCTNPAVAFTTVTCIGGPIGSEDTATVTFRLMINIKNLASILYDNDTVLLSSEGQVRILDPFEIIQYNDNRKLDNAWVITKMIAAPRKKKISAWLITGSVGGGILFLLFIIMGLVKAGFFKRQVKQDLQDLKVKAQVEDEFGIYD